MKRSTEHVSTEPRLNGRLILLLAAAYAELTHWNTTNFKLITHRKWLFNVFQRLVWETRLFQLIQENVFLQRIDVNISKESLNLKLILAVFLPSLILLQALTDKKTTSEWSKKEETVSEVGGASGVMVIVSGIGHGDTSSNPRLIAFHIALISLGKVWIQLFSLQLWVNSRAD